eukprot:symbB.v1.2.004488.t1/scaffold254.1/size251309/11
MPSEVQSLCSFASIEGYLQWSGALTKALHHREQSDPLAFQWIEDTYEVVQQQAFECWQHQGRYWNTELSKTYFESWHMSSEGASHEAADDTWAVILHRLQRLPERLSGGVCAPSSCEEEEVRRRIMPRFLSRKLQFDFDLPVPEKEFLQVMELSHWSQLKLDFVVGGVDSCGTNTLFKGLSQAEEIIFTMEETEEDPFFFKHDSLLPYRREVESFNHEWLGKTSTSGHASRTPSLGLRHPGLFHSHRVRLALREIPRLKVLLVLCDPLSRLEKRFWLQYQCEVNHFAMSQTGRCFRSLKAALEEPDLLQQVAFANHFQQLQRLFDPQRLRVIHQASFRQSFAEVFVDLSQFLGVKRPLALKAGRYNHHGGHRSDLCRNASLVADLKDLLSSEYRAVEELLLSHGNGAPLPEELLLRKTRCDRPEDLAERTLPAVPLERLVPL